jgi:hypothetical protein
MNWARFRARGSTRSAIDDNDLQESLALSAIALARYVYRSRPLRLDELRLNGARQFFNCFHCTIKYYIRGWSCPGLNMAILSSRLSYLKQQMNSA